MVDVQLPDATNHVASALASVTARLFRSAEGRRFIVIAVLLLLLIPFTWMIRGWHLSKIESSVVQQQAERVEDALSYAEQDFLRLQSEILELARGLAEDRQVVRLLRERERSGSVMVSEELIRIVDARSLDQREGLELYDLDPRVIAWKGIDMPMDSAPGSERFLNTYQFALAVDGDRRAAVSAWVPVMDGTRAVGVVRAMRLISQRVPVQNQFIRDFDIADEWQRALRLPIRFEATTSAEPVPRVAGTRLMQGRDGSILGRIVVEPPGVQRIVRDTSARYDHVIAFWATLALAWVTSCAWLLHRRRLFLRTGERAYGAALSLGLLTAWLVVVRVLLLWLDVPARWQRGKSPLAPVFDPAHMASTFGEGLLRSSGDFVITAAFAFALAVAFIQFQLVRKPFSASVLLRKAEDTRRRSRLVLYLIGGAISSIGLAALVRSVAHHVILDSTLDYFSRAALVPSPLELLIFCALLLCVLTAVLLAVVVFWPAARLATGMSLRGDPLARNVLMGWGAAFLLVMALTGALDLASMELLISATLLAATAVVAAFLAGRERQVDLLFLRSILPSLFLLTVTLYPLLYEGMAIQRQHQMLDAADTFAEGRDPRVMFAIEQALRQASGHGDLEAWLSEDPDTAGRRRLDSLASSIVRASLLGSLAGYEVSLTFVDVEGRPRGRYVEAEQALSRSALDEADAAEFDILRQMYRESAATGAMVEQVTGRRDPGRLQYEGVRPIFAGVETEPDGWVMARAEPRPLLQDFATPFPQVLLPASTYESTQAGMSIAEFRDGVIVRNIGREFGRYRLPEEVWQSLQRSREQWQRDVVDQQPYRTYYRRQALTEGAAAGRETISVTAVRVPAINVFDHLFYLLRVVVAGLLIGIPLYVGGLFYRRRIGWLPAPRVRFRDKVLNSFFAVGIVAVLAVGFVGLRLVRVENERSVQTWLRQHLERVEETLALEAGPDEMPYRILERMNVDSLAARVGLDLNVYLGPYLVSSSRPQMIRERLVGSRVPSDAYLSLFYEGYRFTSTTEHVGSFTYTAGFQALPDEQGRPRYILSVPTLPEQERIEEERARTVAYLFGALLLLVLVVMITASILANALARPVARLREGLESVARGRFQRALPVDSRDEIGELVETFNDMQAQLVESRRKLALQERQLAWREMARQVAHEIKNPLTPMKLSVQHLRRAHDAAQETDDGLAGDGKFRKLFDRITVTLIEQIDALARIANEFHTFARLPSRVLDRLDLNLVTEEAIALMREESSAEIIFQPAAKPLMIDADREELRRVFINLIKNADQALDENQNGRIYVRTVSWADGDGEEWAVSEVIDNGSGIPEEIQPKIFEPNFSTKTSGTGLGLAIVRKSIEEMRGSIDFETVPAEGTTFRLQLPLVDDSDSPG